MQDELFAEHTRTSFLPKVCGNCKNYSDGRCWRIGGHEFQCDPNTSVEIAWPVNASKCTGYRAVARYEVKQ